MQGNATMSGGAHSARGDEDVERQQRHVVRIISGDAGQADASSSHHGQADITAVSSSDTRDCPDGGTGKGDVRQEASKEQAWRRWGKRAQSQLPSQLSWIPPTVSSWSKMKPVLRSGLAAWICMLFIIISPVEKIALGQASFLILIGIFIQPAELPFAAVIEREFFTMIMTCAAWAYSNLAIFFAHLARKDRVPQAQTNALAILHGEYIELGPSAICATFLAFGVAFFLYLKVKFGPSPFIFATILSCITVDITLIYAPLYPYPNYLLGRTVVVPLAIKSGIVILVSMIFFPKSVNAAFVEKLLAVLKPLQACSSGLATIMQRSPLDDDFDFELVQNLVAGAEGGLLPLLGSGRLITREITFALAPGEDLKGLFKHTRALIAPADGIAFYMSAIRGNIRGLDAAQHPRASQYATPAPSQPATPMTSRPPSRPSSRGGTPNEKDKTSNEMRQKYFVDKVHEKAQAHVDKGEVQRPELRNRYSSHWRSSNLKRPGQPKNSRDLLRRVRDTFHVQKSHAQINIGLWESLRYHAVESFLHSRHHEIYTELCVRILGDMSKDLLQSQARCFNDLSHWLLALNSQRTIKLRDWLLFRSTQTKDSLLQHIDGSPDTLNESAQHLKRALEAFVAKRIQILEPFKSSVEGVTLSHDGTTALHDRMPHRYLFQSLTFCHFQVEYTERLIDLLAACDKIENEHQVWRFWFPSFPKLFHVATWWSHEDHAEDEGHDEDPEEVPGMASSLGEAQARDPDALDSDSAFHNAGVKLSIWLHQLYKGNSLFMIKVGIVTVLVALPSYYKASAGWAYDNKAIWPVIMSQLVTARHRGEVLAGLFSRALATFLGALGGLIIWYIAAGNGSGNPYAMAVVTAIAFPIVMLGRIHFPGPPITPIITCVTVALIVGYSWKDSHDPSAGNVGRGWEVAWRRFVEVIIGAAASYVMAVLPPSSSTRTYFRVSHATILRESGGLFCTAIAIAANPSQKPEITDVQAQLLAVRTKIRRLAMLKGSIAFEWSLRGRWPLRRYAELERVEIRILRLLTHMLTIYERLGPSYSRALLGRTNFLDPAFLADCIAVLSMCATSLRTRSPLPQIVPVLIDRYLSLAWGFNIRNDTARDREDALAAFDSSDFAGVDSQNDAAAVPGAAAETPKGVFDNLPEKVTFETLCDPQYQIFAVGAQVAFGLVLHIDRLCVAVKALVGETYAVPADLQQYQYLTLLR